MAGAPRRWMSPVARPGRAGRGLLALTLGAVLMGGLTGCDTWFGAREDPPLPGERIAVLLNARTLEPDPKLADAEILLPPPAVNPDWPQPGGYANHAMHHLAVGETLSQAWSVDIGTGGDDEERLIAPPVVADGRVYAMDAESAVAAFDAATGESLWHTDLTPDEEDDGHISGGITFGDGRIYAATGFAEVVALDAATGQELWRRQVEAPMRVAPTTRGGRVFVVTTDNRLIALNGRTGETLWTHAGEAEVAGLLGGGSPAVDNGVVVAPFSTGELVALRVDTGRLLWSDTLLAVRRTDVVSTLAAIRGRPVIDRGRVFAISHGGLMVAIDLRTGRRVWEREIAGYESPWVAGRYVFTLTSSAELVCLDRDTGRVYWVSTLPQYEDEENREDPIVWAGPILASDRLIVSGSNGQAWAVSPYTGNPLGRIEMPDPVDVPPVIAGGTLYFLTDGADLVAYR
ncbi:MAG: PQQ-binding-like beta-propeller repeat protein [Rhodobacterales bacterium]|nr:PQQ-binding-like beta-propeller repeat protein [Rhodobacterales bacterium]